MLPTTSRNLSNLKSNKFLVGNSPKVIINLDFNYIIFQNLIIMANDLKNYYLKL